MISSPIAVIDAAGITVPVYSDILAYFQEQYRSIYGTDIDLDADTQDGQWMAIISQACNDANMTIEQTYQSYSPTYAQGVGLSSVVKINGIRRHTASNSSVPVTAVGQAGVDISGALVGDTLNLETRWLLPQGVVIPPGGEITTTAVATSAGAIRADVDTITHILTPIPGWQTVTNHSAATPGLAVETDAQLRRRQTYSVANPSQTVVVGIEGAVASVEGVKRAFVYENPSSVADGNGLPPYSIAVVVEGGSAAQIAQAIALRKTPGSPTFGTTQILYTDQRGVPSLINFFDLILVPIKITIGLNALAGFSQIIADQIVAQVVDFVVNLPIGYDCFLTKIIAATQLAEPAGLTYEVTSVVQGRDANTPAASDIAIAFKEAAYTETALITINVAPLPGPSYRRR